MCTHAGISCLLQIRDEYEAVKDSKAPEQPAAKRAAVANGAAPSLGGATEVVTAAEDGASGRSTTARLLDSIAAERPRSACSSSAVLLSSYPGWSHCTCIRMPETAAAHVSCMCIHVILTSKVQSNPTAHTYSFPWSLCCSASGAGAQQQLVVHGAMNGAANDISKALLLPSAAVAKRLPSKWPRPVWHPPWKLFRVISGHLGYVHLPVITLSAHLFASVRTRMRDSWIMHVVIQPVTQ